MNIIPIADVASQDFAITLESTRYTFFIYRNTRSAQWKMSISQDNVVLHHGVALAGGIDILKQFNDGPSNLFAINVNNPSLDLPEDLLADVARLVNLTPEELPDGS